MEKRVIYTDKNRRELKRALSGDFPVRIEHERLFDFIRHTVQFHWHPELELVFITEGSVLCQANGTAYHMKKGDGLLINTNTLHAYLPDGEWDCLYDAILFDPSILARPGSRIYEKQISPVLSSGELSAIPLAKTVRWQSEILKLIEEISRLDLAAPDCLELEILERLIRIWKLLFLYALKEIPASPGHSKDILRMKEAINFVQNHFSEPLTLNDIAASCHLSQSECCRLFKRILHQSPIEYVISCRISQSLPLLADSSLPVTEIAGMTGFQSSSYFTETFRRLTGTTPSRYRRQLTDT